jgi:hypothetical protein
MEHNLMGIIESPKYYSENDSSPITANDPKGFLRPRKEMQKSGEHYEL